MRARFWMIAALASLLAACGGQAAPTQAPATPTAAPATSVAAAPTSTPAPTLAPATPTPLQLALEWAGFAGYRVRPGDTLESISQRGGSLPILISRYNRLSGEPSPGRELIVPQLPATTSTLSSENMLVLKGNTAQPWVALTLDAGDKSEPTPSMLDTLAANNVRITFFLTGAWMDKNPELTRRIVADGHEIANHSYSHRDFTTLSDAEIADELRRTEETLARIAGPEVSLRPFFRPPYGAQDDRVLAAVIANGYLPIYWTFDSLDSVGEPKTAEFLTARITAALP
ncbi:MAG TPA: polysaccharide deacetylase family protein, partial [Herpetosiphonaceae bacterium]|nr:polysaccharide deacetylase family protein [Herpetosiphonaceae bacterium]